MQQLQRKTGFTIVELLIVIVVVAILAAISIVAYNGIQVRAETASKTLEAKHWITAFTGYRASEGKWPTSMTPGTYFCLGKGFPTGTGGVARCRDIQSTTLGYLESNNNDVMTELASYASVSSSNKKPYTNVVGPYARIYSDGSQTLEITQIFSPNVQCPEPLTQQFRNTSTLWCETKLIP